MKSTKYNLWPNSDNDKWVVSTTVPGTNNELVIFECKTKEISKKMKEILDIQEEQIQRWACVLNDKAMLALLQERDKRNELINDNTDPYQVWRGTQIDEFILNLAVKIHASL